MQKSRLTDKAIKNTTNAFLGNYKVNSKIVVNGFINLKMSTLEYLMSVSSEKKALSALKMVLFNENPKKYIEDLDFVNKKKLQLAYLLCKRESVIILDYFEKGLSYKERNYFKKLFKRLNEYNITIIINTNNLEFLFDCCNNIFILQDDDFVLVEKDWYNEELYSVISTPAIVSFVNMFNKKKKYVDNYCDIKELLKAIFRVMP